MWLHLKGLEFLGHKPHPDSGISANAGPSADGQRDTLWAAWVLRVRTAALPPPQGAKLGGSTETSSPETSPSLQLNSVTEEEAEPPKEDPCDLRQLTNG